MSRFDRIAQWGVLLILALNAGLMLVLPSFPTLDGWPHLHTARMLMDGSLGDVYCPNPGSVPNRVGHLLLGALQVVLPSMFAERVLLAMIIWLIGWGTWLLARAFGGTSLLILLVLPFTWNFLLVMGFHNFLIGLGLALVGAAVWVRTKHIGPANVLALTLWAILLFQTHPTALIFFLVVTGAHELAVLLGAQERTGLRVLGHDRPGVFAFVLACLPALFMLFAFQSGQGDHWSEAEPGTALSELKDLRSLLLFDGWDEGKFGYAMKLVMVAAVAVVLLVRTRAFRSLRPVPEHRDLLLIVALLLFVGHAFVPDSTGTASYITVRLQLMGMLVFIAWLATQPVPDIAAVVPVILLLMVHQARLRYIDETTLPLAEQRDKVLEAAQHLPVGAMVLPISFEHQWVLGHIGSLLAVERKVTLLDNYECSNDYFPLRWCAELPEPLLVHLGSEVRCLEWLEEHITSRTWPIVDHIVLLGRDTIGLRCDLPVLATVLDSHFVAGFNNGYARIHTLRPVP